MQSMTQPDAQPRLEVIEGGAAQTPPTSLLALPITGAWLRKEQLLDAGITSAKRVESIKGYPKSTGWARFTSEGVTVGGKVAAPPAEAVERMLAEIASAGFPTMISLTAISEPPPKCDLNDRSTFVCHDFDGRVTMIHQRYETKDGTKGFLPWTKWSDGQWRRMEPDTMPFYGLPGAKEHSTLVLHEGAKSAAFVTRMLSGEEDASRFPWLEELRWAAHIGWIGGVHAIDRSDWSSLVAMGWKRIIIVADNDHDGKGLKAARLIAGEFNANVWICAFDARFKDGFDLADPLPDEMFDDGGRFFGPTFADFLIPATKATNLLPADGRGRRTAVLRDEFAGTTAYTVQPPRIMFLHHPSRDRRPEEFNTIIAPFSDVKDTAQKVFERLECQHERMVYRPGEPSGTITVDGQRCFNVYEGGAVRATDGDPAPWEAFLNHLFPDADERPSARKYLATLIAKPKVRMRYGMLLISAKQGVGKSTLGMILRTQMGASNVSFPSESSVVDSAFNGWAARKRLIFISEFYSGQKRKAYDKLKSLVTDDVIEVNEKGVNQYELDNAATIIACSNSEEALYLDDEDRRWLVPTVSESLQAEQWWTELRQWLSADGPGIILSWAERYVAEHGHVGTGDHAPGSKRKTVIADASRSPALKLAVEMAEHLVSIDRKVILPMREVRKWIALQLGFRHADGSANIADKRLGKPETVSKGLKRVEGVTVWADAKRPKIAGTRETVVMNFTPGPEAEWADIKDHLTNLEGVKLDDPF